jgi:hypothetical protein
MKKRFACVALSALALAAPAAAERIYVPVLGTTAADGSVLATRVRIGNADGVEAPVAARFRDASGVPSQETERAVTARPASRVLADLSPAGRTGLITLEADSALEVSAWMANRSGGDFEVPAFTDAEAYSAGVDVQLDEMPRPRAVRSLFVGAANLSDKTASCQATLFTRDGSRSAEIQFEVPAMSLARKNGLASANRGRVSSVRVTCDQSFYPFAVAADTSGRSIVTKGVGPNGACTSYLNLNRQPTGYYVAESQPIIFHTATKADPKGILCIKAPSELKIAKATFEWDVIPGPWSTRDRSGLHNLGYFFLDRYRGGTVGNVNVAGPNKSFVKFMQNVGMPAGTNTNNKVSYVMQPGVTYHQIYTFDAVNKMATLQLFLNGIQVVKVTKDAKPGNNQALIVRPFGQGGQAGLAMVAEFGNYTGQHHPEEASLGWKYAGFRVTLVPK